MKAWHRYLAMPAQGLLLAALLTIGVSAGARAQIVVDGEVFFINFPFSVSTSGTGEANAGFLVTNGGTIDGATSNVFVTTLGDGAPGVLATAAGTATFSAGTEITTSGSGAFGLLARDPGSMITATGMIILTSGASADGVRAESGGKIALTGGSITTTNTDAIGASARSGGLLQLDGVSISTSGTGSHGLLATGAGSQITTTNASITTAGTGAIGAQIDFGSTATFNGGTITTLGGPSSHGILVQNGGILTATGVIVITNGAAQGVQAGDNGFVTLTGGSVTTRGSDSFGIRSDLGPSGTGGVLNATDVVVRTEGPNSIGAFTTFKLNVTGGSITTTGDGAFALGTGIAGAILNANKVTMSTSGVSAHGVLTSGGVINIVDSTISATGPDSGGIISFLPGLVTALRTTVSGTRDGAASFSSGALLLTDSDVTGGRHGLASFDGTSAAPSVIVMSGGSLKAALDAIHAENTVARITLSNGTVVTAGSGNLLNVISADPASFISDVVFTAQGITAAGNIISDAASTTTVNLLENTTITGIQKNTFTTVDATSKWIMNGNSDIFSLTLAGLVEFTPPVDGVFKTLTTVNYVGTSGIMVMNTFLGSDGSPSDKLVINGGSATGDTLLLFRNAGGPGALTVGNGILAVDAINGGTTAPGAFRGFAVAGPYEYTLFRGSKDASAAESWFLRSALDCTAPNAPSPPCLAPSPPGPAPEPPPVPHFRREVSLAAALPALALLYGRTLFDTLHERVGEEEHLRARPDLSGSPYLNGVWGRVLAQTGDREGHPVGIYGHGPKLDYDFTAIQAGFDFLRLQQPGGGRLHAGLLGALGIGNGDLTHFNGIAAGRDNLTAYSLGAYATYFGAAGWYLDGLVAGTFYDLKADSGRLAALETDGWGLAASLESGVPIKFGSFVIEPQVQIVYQTIGIEDAREIAADIRFEDVDSLAGRVGVRFANTWTIPAGTWGLTQPGLVTAWVRPSLWQEWLGDPRTLFSSATGFIPFRAHLGDEWFDLNGGLTVRLDRTTSLYANASYQWGLAGDSEAWAGKIGLRVNW